MSKFLLLIYHYYPLPIYSISRSNLPLILSPQDIPKCVTLSNLIRFCLSWIRPFDPSTNLENGIWNNREYYVHIIWMGKFNFNKITRQKITLHQCFQWESYLCYLPIRSTSGIQHIVIYIIPGDIVEPFTRYIEEVGSAVASHFEHERVVKMPVVSCSPFKRFLKRKLMRTLMGELISD